MPGSRLIPETQLVFSAELAAAIGLEEAVLLQQIQNLYLHQPASRRGELAWLHVGEAYLLQLMPFWDRAALKRICASLEAKGLVCVDRQNAAHDGVLVAINDAPSPPVTAASPAAEPRPGEVSPHTATDTSTRGTMPSAAARDPAAAHPVPARRSPAPQRSPRPPERPGRGEGQPLPPDFQPSEDMLELLELFHGVPRSFALQQLEDFTLYWRERGSAGHAWQNRFRQHVQFHWARHQQEKSGVEHAGQRGTGAARRTRDSSLEHDLTDTSWAD